MRLLIFDYFVLINFANSAQWILLGVHIGVYKPYNWL